MWKTILIIAFLAIQVQSETYEEFLASAQRAVEISDEKLSDSALFASLDMEVPSLEKKHLQTIIEQTAIEVPKEEIKWKEAVLAGTVLLTWISMGINEGQKWKYDRTGEIDFIWKEDYHLYRGIHNGGLVTAPLIALSMDRNKNSIKWIVGSNLIGWGLYEVALSYASNESILGPKPEFRILGMGFNRPDALFCLGLSVFSAATFTYSF